MKEWIAERRKGSDLMSKLLLRNKELEKEKCELLGIIQGKDEVIEQLKEQNKDLCESLDIMNNRESELLDQIEKMKRCFNCSKWFSNTELCVSNERGTNICDKWELAE